MSPTTTSALAAAPALIVTGAARTSRVPITRLSRRSCRPSPTPRRGRERAGPAGAVPAVHGHGRRALPDLPHAAAWCHRGMWLRVRILPRQAGLLDGPHDRAGGSRAALERATCRRPATTRRLASRTSGPRPPPVTRGRDGRRAWFPGRFPGPAAHPLSATDEKGNADDRPSAP